MAEQSPRQVWSMRAVYLALGMVVIFFHLLPLRALPDAIAGPDLLVALTFAWAMRRPDFVPAPAIAALMLLADLLFQRPPGLWAVLVLLAAEWLKRRERRLRDGTFAPEWLTVAAILLVITIVYRLVLGILIVAPERFLLALSQYGFTVLIYPVVVGLSWLVLRVRRASPGEFDAMGRAL
ncbi:rod shape-determining protein MreD [Thalassococcus sp. CAU 1522]|uniref:Rod shape-determining protein MreD n=1 Tax=Thalassococcus arenae TaxID=2851652 RepID=A0ABS6N8D5_9RHOB|nr:rod shape-determining protein MreD [Thalassococcus arenae]MBV2360277.1 rod shape-determining protein MreD [Thalassococcus arenae]